MSWSPAAALPLPNSPTTCLAPTSGHGAQLTHPGPHKGRLLFVGVHNAYKGDVRMQSPVTCLLSPAALPLLYKHNMLDPWAWEFAGDCLLGRSRENVQQLWSAPPGRPG
jgi:hypothetical protein